MMCCMVSPCRSRPRPWVDSACSCCLLDDLHLSLNGLHAYIHHKDSNVAVQAFDMDGSAS